MMNFSGMGNATGRAESMLGRRLRPWWGKSPGNLLAGAIVRVFVLGLLIYGCYLVRYGSVDLTEVDLADGSLEDHRSTIETAALWVAVGAAVLVLYNLVQIIVGAFDLFVRRDVEGPLLQAQERRTGDFLPGIVQQMWFRRRDGHGNRVTRSRRRRNEVVIATSRGPKSWNVGYKHFSKVRGRSGGLVRLRVSPLLGYVSRIDVLEPPAQTPAQPWGSNHQYTQRG